MRSRRRRSEGLRVWLARWVPRPAMHVETLLLWLCLYFVAAGNGRFWSELSTPPLSDLTSNIKLMASVALVALALQFVILAPWLNRFAMKWLLVLVSILAAFAAVYLRSHRAPVDPTFVRNLFGTDWLHPRKFPSLTTSAEMGLYGGFPITLITLTRLRERTFPRAVIARTAAIVVALSIGTVPALSSLPGISSIVRSKQELLYLLTPANYFIAAAQIVASADARLGAPPAISPLTTARRESWKVSQFRESEFRRAHSLRSCRSCPEADSAKPSAVILQGNAQHCSINQSIKREISGGDA